MRFRTPRFFFVIAATGATPGISRDFIVLEILSANFTAKPIQNIVGRFTHKIISPRKSSDSRSWPFADIAGTTLFF